MNNINRAQQQVLDKLKQLSVEGKTANNLRFILLDIVEQLNMISEREGRKVGLYDNRHVATMFNQLKFATADLRKLTRGMDEGNQEDFGNAADLIYQMLIIALDRTDESGNQMKLFVDYISKFQSVNKFNLIKMGV